MISVKQFVYVKRSPKEEFTGAYQLLSNGGPFTERQGDIVRLDFAGRHLVHQLVCWSLGDRHLVRCQYAASLGDIRNVQHVLIDSGLGESPFRRNERISSCLFLERNRFPRFDGHHVLYYEVVFVFGDRCPYKAGQDYCDLVFRATPKVKVRFHVVFYWSKAPYLSFRRLCAIRATAQGLQGLPEFFCSRDSGYVTHDYSYENLACFLCCRSTAQKYARPGNSTGVEREIFQTLSILSALIPSWPAPTRRLRRTSIQRHGANFLILVAQASYFGYWGVDSQTGGFWPVEFRPPR